MKSTIVAIFSNQYFDCYGNIKLIGGIETYIFYLARLCKKLSLKPIIFQYSHKYFERIDNDIKVIGLPVMHNKSKKRKFYAFQLAAQIINTNNDIVIFAREGCVVPCKSNRRVAIQHGISWDLPNNIISPRRIWQYPWANKLFRIRLQRKAIHFYEQCPNHVFVDYNFLNWLRAVYPIQSLGHDWVIPNFAETQDLKTIRERKESTSGLKILFARRFYEYRGTRIMAQAIKPLLRKYSHISVTFAGEGKEESWIRDYFLNESRVYVKKFYLEQMSDVYLKHHVVVVPSLGSEGTSLSVAEAMACGCAVVATSVGGITNMIIDDYNGKLCMPTATELEKCIEELIVNDEQRGLMAEKAYDTAKHAFSREKWEIAWSKVIHILGG